MDEITGLVGNLTFLHVDCPTTAEWASRRIGDAEVLAQFTNTSAGTSQSGKDSSQSWNESLSQSLMTRRAVLQGELLHLGAARPDATVDGYHMLREVNAVYRARLRFSYHDGDADDDFRPRGELVASMASSRHTSDRAKLIGINEQHRDDTPFATRPPANR